MMTAPTSVSALIGNWKTIGAFAIAIGCGYEAARQMRNRESIAPEHWSAVIAASSEMGIPDVTYEWLAAQRSKPEQMSEAS